jgi:hypothetical protein
MENISSYIEKLERKVYEKISNEIIISSLDAIVNENLHFHIQDAKSASFQKFYFETINNENFYFENSDFFRQFKYQYALQGIDSSFLLKLEDNKSRILELIRKDDLATLYFEYFFKTKLKHRNKFIEKDLGSFFAKLVHTFNPERYCALDNPVKNYFGLVKESFFVSFHIISRAYYTWGKNNKEIFEKIKTMLSQIDKESLIKQDKLTDLKLLDLIYWTKANIKK